MIDIAAQICADLEKLAVLLSNKFRNSEAQLDSEIVTKLYEKVRNEAPKAPTRREDSFNESKIRFNSVVRRITDNFFTSFVDPNLARVEASTNMDFLNVLLTNWGYIKVFAMTFKLVLSKHSNFYLYAREIKEDCPPVAQMVLQAVREHVLQKHKPKILRIITETFEEERNHENTEKEKVKTLINIIENCGLSEISDVVSVSFKMKTIEFRKYELERNERIIPTTNTPFNFFKEEYLGGICRSCGDSYVKRIAGMPTEPSQYVTEVNRILKSQRERAAYYFFDKAFEQEYLTFIERELVDKRIEDVLRHEGGLKSFIEASSCKNLESTYSICKRRREKTFDYIKKTMSEYFYEQGKKFGDVYLQQEKRDSSAFIDGIIALKKKCNEIVEKFFNNDIEFIRLKIQIFRDILRYEGEKDSKKKIDFMGAKNLAQDTDRKIIECARLESEDKREEILNNIVLVFESLMAPDVFLIEHQKAMKKRLLELYSGKPSPYIQKQLITKLQQFVTPRDVEKHLAMIRDFEESVRREERMSDMTTEDVKTRIQPIVITNDVWPDNENVDIVFPTALIAERAKVETLYKIEFRESRWLIWKPNIGVSVIDGKFQDKSYRFTMNNLMMFILLHISEGKKQAMLFGDLRQKFKLKRVKAVEETGSVFDGEFKLNLLGLVEHKLVFRDRGLDTTINEGEVFKINPEYVFVPKETAKTVSRSRIIPVTVIPSAKLRSELKGAGFSSAEIIKKNRQHIMNGVLVQVMKSSNVISFDKLCEEVRKHRQMQNMDYKISDIKERVEHLITTEFCVRNEQDKSMITYIP